MYYDQPSSYDAALYAEADMTVDFVLPDGRCKTARIILPCDTVSRFYAQLQETPDNAYIITPVIGSGVLRTHLRANLNFDGEEFALPYVEFNRLAKAKALALLQ